MTSGINSYDVKMCYIFLRSNLELIFYNYTRQNKMKKHKRHYYRVKLKEFLDDGLGWNDLTSTGRMSVGTEIMAFDYHKKSSIEIMELLGTESMFSVFAAIINYTNYATLSNGLVASNDPITERDDFIGLGVIKKKLRDSAARAFTNSTLGRELDNHDVMIISQAFVKFIDLSPVEFNRYLMTLSE